MILAWGVRKPAAHERLLLPLLPQSRELVAQDLTKSVKLLIAFKMTSVQVTIKMPQKMTKSKALEKGGTQRRRAKPFSGLLKKLEWRAWRSPAQPLNLSFATFRS